MAHTQSNVSLLVATLLWLCKAQAEEDICLDGRADDAYIEEIGADNVGYCLDGATNSFPRYVAPTSSGDAIMEYSPSIDEAGGNEGYTIYHEDAVRGYCLGVTDVLQCGNQWIVMDWEHTFIADADMNTTQCNCTEANGDDDSGDGSPFCNNNEWTSLTGSWEFTGSYDSTTDTDTCVMESTAIATNNVALIEIDHDIGVCDFGVEFEMTISTAEHAGMFMRSVYPGTAGAVCLQGYYFGVIPSTPKQFMLGTYNSACEFTGLTQSITDSIYEAVAEGELLTIEFKVDGDILTGGINGVQQGSIKDDTLTCGSVGFMTYGGLASFSHLTPTYMGSDSDSICVDVEPGTFIWETLTAYGVDIPYFNYSMDVIDDDLSLNIHVELEYLGLTSADDQGAVFGTTYVLDFESYDAHESVIYSPGTCQNRVSDSFYEDGNKKNFSTWWLYSDDPTVDGTIGSGHYLAYPPTDETQWNISMSDDEPCGIVVYDGHFTWNELVQCIGIQTTDTAHNITLNGVFYINVVSPIDYTRDAGYYRVYQLLSAPFTIAVIKSVYVLGEAGINVLTMSVIAVYKENQQNTFTLVLLTESQNYLALTRGSSSLYIFAPDVDGDATIETGEFDAPEVDEQSGGCLDNKLNICSQLWEIKADNVDCQTKGIDFSGEYTLVFNTSCRDEVDGNTAYNDYCVGWLDEHPAIKDGVQLTSKLTWRDDVCDPLLFELQFSAEMKFFTNASFSDDGGGSHLYQVGEDTIYVEIDTSFPGDTYTVFNTTLINVWICTFDPLHNVMDPDPDTASGGCFDPERDGSDTDDDKYFYHIYSIDGPITEEDFTLIGHPDDTDASKQILRFYFVVPHKIARDKLYIHTHVEVTLNGEQASGSADESSANQMDHFLTDVNIIQNPEDDNPINNEPEEPQQPQQPLQEPFNYNPQPDIPILNTSPWVIAIGILLGVIISFNTVLLCYFKYCESKQQRDRMSLNRTRRAGYASVKYIDSDDFHDSEINVIDVSSD